MAQSYSESVFSMPHREIPFMCFDFIFLLDSPNTVAQETLDVQRAVFQNKWHVFCFCEWLITFYQKLIASSFGRIEFETNQMERKKDYLLPQHINFLSHKMSEMIQMKILK
jgi:hypothetical protein